MSDKFTEREKSFEKKFARDEELQFKVQARSNKYISEFLGSAFLFCAVVGSGIMAENLANGNNAVALLGNTLATGAILFVLIKMFGSISGAHFNPAVSLVFYLRKEKKYRFIQVFTSTCVDWQQQSLMYVKLILIKIIKKNKHSLILL